MISVEEAKNIIELQKANWGNHKVALSSSLGEVLAEDIYADRDFPPFNRVTMDGIALSYDAFASGKREFIVQGMQLAGEAAIALKGEEFAIEIMTGAVLSEGCDLIIRYEDLEFFEAKEKVVKINLETVERWKNVHHQGSDQKNGERIISKGARVTAAEIAIMATVGCHEVLVRKKPKVAIVSTGDELVDVEAKPLAHQIRKSNSIAMEASLNQMKVSNELFHLPDNKAELKTKIREILKEFDVVLMSGGVSKGKADYLPEVLDELGVIKLFHKVAQRPGKPFWFGVHNNETPVFAFPGNPISTYMCFRVYFIPWLVNNLGGKIQTVLAHIQSEAEFKPELGYFLQVSSDMSKEGNIIVSPEFGNGSGDLANLTKSDAFLYLPAIQNQFEAGKFYEYYSFDTSNLA